MARYYLLLLLPALQSQADAAQADDRRAAATAATSWVQPLQQVPRTASNGGSPSGPAATSQTTQSGGQGASGLATIAARLYADTMPPRCTDVCSSATKFAAAMQGDGSWQDLNYKSKSHVSWPAVSHWDRLTSLAEAMHCPGCKEATAVALLPKIIVAVKYWQANNFLDPNCEQSLAVSRQWCHPTGFMLVRGCGTDTLHACNRVVERLWRAYGAE
jgi:hypothetical protein